MATESPVVDASGITLAGDRAATVDVLFDGRRVCSLQPTRGALAPDGTRMLRWPRALRGFLHGVTDVVLREHVSGDVIYQATVRFDDRDERVQVSDDDGVPVVVDKWGQLGRAFEGGAATHAEQLAKEVSHLLRDLNERVGVPAFVAYGTLLGAVRTGHVIGHDFDADVASLSAHSHPADIALESFAIQRRLTELGWESHRTRSSMVQVWVTDDLGIVRHIDIFAAYFNDALFNVDRWVEGPLRRDQVLPLAEVELEGHRLPAPADPRSVLALTYGPLWEVPDPAFKFDPAPAHARRVTGWMGNFRARRGRWTRWHREAATVHQPSAFSTWVSDQLEPDTLVLDVGCGRGADTIALAGATGRATGVDYSSRAVAAAEDSAATVGSSASFAVVSVLDLRLAVAHTATVATAEGSKALYARLTLDALSPGGRQNLWWMARTLLLGGGGRAFLEFRDEPGNPFGSEAPAPWYGLVDATSVREEIAARGGFIEHEEVVPGDRVSRPRRPALRRVVARW